MSIQRTDDSLTKTLELGRKWQNIFQAMKCNYPSLLLYGMDEKKRRELHTYQKFVLLQMVYIYYIKAKMGRQT